MRSPFVRARPIGSGNGSGVSGGWPSARHTWPALALLLLPRAMYALQSHRYVLPDTSHFACTAQGMNSVWLTSGGSPALAAAASNPRAPLPNRGVRRHPREVVRALRIALTAVLLTTIAYATLVPLLQMFEPSASMSGAVRTSCPVTVSITTDCRTQYADYYVHSLC